MSAPTHTHGFRIKGWHVLVAMVSFFGVVIGVNTVFITVALDSFPGEETRRSYVQGLDYNSVLEARQAQAALGWSASANLTASQVLIEIRDGDDTPVRGLSFAGTLQHPATMSRDISLTFDETSPGVYAAPQSGLTEGRWVLVAQTDGAPPFELETELWHR